MSDIAFAIWMLGSAMVGASIGTVVMSILASSKRGDEDTYTPEVFLEGIRRFGTNLNKVTVMSCCRCSEVYTLNMYIKNLCCPYCGTIGRRDE